MNPVIIGNATLHLGDCIEVMAGLPENSLDSIICDPPYLISFMNKGFDAQHKSLPGENEGQKMQEWHRRWVTEAYRILKPGGHLAAFGGDRTHHRLMSAMEDIGFELRFNCYWIFSTGFPKSLDASKALDQHFGLKDQREIIGERDYSYSDTDRPSKKSVHSIRREDTLNIGGFIGSKIPVTEPVHKIAKQWSGYGTALKPAVEPICVGRKPMIGTLAENLLEWGTGAMNLDACRLGENAEWSYPNGRGGKGWQDKESLSKNLSEPIAATKGRFPPHLLHDGSDLVKKCFPETTSGAIDPSRHVHKHGKGNALSGSRDGSLNNYLPHQKHEASSGSASRFFPALPYDEEDCATICYCAKASKRDRDEGCDFIDKKELKAYNDFSVTAEHSPKLNVLSHNNHPTIKPTNLMRWLTRLLTPKGGILLDPFMGSGSTLKAAVLENFTCIGIEINPDYFAIAEARVAHVSPEVYVAPPLRPERAEDAQRQQRMF